MKRYTGETAWRHAKFIGQRYDRYVSPYAMAGRVATKLDLDTAAREAVVAAAREQGLLDTADPEP